MKPQTWVVEVTVICENELQYELSYKFDTEIKARAVYEFLLENRLKGTFNEKIFLYEQKNDFLSVEEALGNYVRDSYVRDDEQREELYEKIENYIEKWEEEQPEKAEEEN